MTTATDYRCPNCKRWMAKVEPPLYPDQKLVRYCRHCKREWTFVGNGAVR